MYYYYYLIFITKEGIALLPAVTTTGRGKLSILNNRISVFEYEVEEQGNYSVKVWERKYLVILLMTSALPSIGMDWSWQKGRTFYSF